MFGRKFFKAVKTSGKAPQAAAHGWIDRFEAMIIRGWAVGSMKQSAGIELFGNGMPIDAKLRRTIRGDVAAKFALSASIPYGFELEPSTTVWGLVPTAAPLKLEVRVDGTPLRTIELDISHLQRWAAQWQALPPSPDRERQLAMLVRHAVAAGGATALRQLASDELLAELVRRGIDLQRPLDLDSVSSAVPLTDVRGRIEAFKNLKFSGWVADLEHEAEHFSIRCNGQVVECEATRINRGDVNRAIQAAGRHLGFEVSLPTAIWAHKDRDGVCAIELLVNQTPLGVGPVRLDLTVLDAAVLQLKEEEERANASGGMTGRVERNYRKQVLAEHLAAAGGLASMSLASANYIGDAVRTWGLRGDGSSMGSAVQSEGAAVELNDEQLALRRLIWQLQRQFNRLVQADGSNAVDALQDTLRVSGLHGNDRAEFLLTLVPFFCGCGRFTDIASWLPVQQVRPLLDSSDNWRGSLLVPFLVHADDVAGACKALRRIALDVNNGWIETGCLLEGARQMVASNQAGRTSPADSAAYVAEFLGVLDAFGGDYWSRLHDRNLIRSLVHLLSHAWLLADDSQRALVAAALRHYGLTQPFWDEYAAFVGPDALLAPKEDMDQALQLFKAVDGRYAAPPASADDWAAALRELSIVRVWGNRDVDQRLRELLLIASSSPGDSHAREAAWDHLGATERLRAAGGVMPPEPLLRHAAAEGAIRLSAHRSLKQHCIEQAQQVSRDMRNAGLTVAQRSFQQLVRITGPLLTPACGCMGIELWVSAWLTLRGPLAAALDAPSLLAEALAKCPQSGVLPAGLINAYLMLKQALRQASDTNVEALIATFEVHHTALLELGDRLLPQASLALPSAAGTRTLVAILVNGAAELRMPRIREGWAAELTAQSDHYVFVVPGGQEEGAQLSGDVLTVAAPASEEGVEPDLAPALINWVLHHTDFSYLYVLDDRCSVNVALWRRDQPHLGQHYSGPAAGPSGYALSRYAMGLLGAANPPDATGAPRVMDASSIHDRLTMGGLALVRDDYVVHTAPSVGAGEGESSFPYRLGPGSPTLVEQGYGVASASTGAIASNAAASLQPQHLWPTYTRASLAAGGAHNRLALVSPPSRLLHIGAADPVVVAVARNERVLVPYFLAHYRSLGVRQFVMVDNMSTDGTLEYLQAQDDVVLYRTDTEYKHSHYGVAWQQALMAAHCAGKWALLADLDEFLVYPHCESLSLQEQLLELARAGHNAAVVGMVDMYPQGPLAQADFSKAAPFALAPCFDADPLVHWKLGAGHYGAQATWLSAARHRLIADSAPNQYTSQKVALLRYHPGVRLAEGLHYASGLKVAEKSRLWFAHFKYHAGFRSKVIEEVDRAQHYNEAEEYRKYLDFWRITGGAMFDAAVSRIYTDGRSFSDHADT